MTLNKYVAMPDEPRYEDDLDAHIQRLRSILKLMAPESGAQALGAMRKAAPNVPLKDRVRALTGPRG
jgi:hypothetical protein